MTQYHSTRNFHPNHRAAKILRGYGLLFLLLMVGHFVSGYFVKRQNLTGWLNLPWSWQVIDYAVQTPGSHNRDWNDVVLLWSPQSPAAVLKTLNATVPASMNGGPATVSYRDNAQDFSSQCCPQLWEPDAKLPVSYVAGFCGVNTPGAPGAAQYGGAQIVLNFRVSANGLGSIIVMRECAASMEGPTLCT